MRHKFWDGFAINRHNFSDGLKVPSLLLNTTEHKMKYDAISDG